MPLIKICGVARQTDAEALDGFVDYIGFIMEPTSPRSVDAAKLAALRGSIYRSKAVLVTASLPPRDAVDTAARLEIPVVQHHGQLTPGDYDYAEGRGIALAPVSVYRPGADLRKKVEDLLRLRHEYVLVDADKKSQGRYEGGLKIPLSALAQVVHLGKVAVAGGVTPENAHLIAGLRPYMVDVASGVEDAPGVKNMEKVRALLKVLGR